MSHPPVHGGGRYPAPGRRGRRPLRWLTMPFAIQPASAVIVTGSSGPGRPALRRLTIQFAMQPALVVGVTRLRAAGGVGPLQGGNH